MWWNEVSGKKKRTCQLSVNVSKTRILGAQQHTANKFRHASHWSRALGSSSVKAMFIFWNNRRTVLQISWATFTLFFVQKHIFFHTSGSCDIHELTDENHNYATKPRFIPTNSYLQLSTSLNWDSWIRTERSWFSYRYV
jgi:hypothetical protein